LKYYKIKFISVKIAQKNKTKNCLKNLKFGFLKFFSKLTKT